MVEILKQKVGFQPVASLENKHVNLGVHFQFVSRLIIDHTLLANHHAFCVPQGFGGFGELVHSFGDLGSPAKKEKVNFKNRTL